MRDFTDLHVFLCTDQFIMVVVLAFSTIQNPRPFQRLPLQQAQSSLFPSLKISQVYDSADRKIRVYIVLAP